MEWNDLGPPWCQCLKTASNLLSVAFVLEELYFWILWSPNPLWSERFCFMKIVLRTYIFSPLTRSQCCVLKQCQEKIARAKSLGFELYDNMGYTELHFLVIFKENYLLKTYPSQIMGICMEKPKILWDARSYVLAIEKTVPEGLFWVHRETYQVSGTDKDVQVSVWRSPRHEERKNASQNCGYEWWHLCTWVTW